MKPIYFKSLILSVLVIHSITVLAQVDDAENVELFEFHKNDSIRALQRDSARVLIIDPSDLKVILNEKISWLEKNLKSKNRIVILSFIEQNNVQYVKLEANLKEGWTTYSRNLVGTFMVKEYRIFVLNYFSLPITSYFEITKEKYNLPKKDESEFPCVIEFPTWIFIKDGEVFKEISYYGY